MINKFAKSLLPAYMIFFLVVLLLYYTFIPRHIEGKSLLTINVMLASFLYIFSHFMRMLRLYVLALEEKVKFSKIFKLYFYILFISFPFPYKAGEIVKIIELNIFFNSKIKGLLLVLLERFSDSIILLIFIIALFIGYPSVFNYLSNIFFILLFVVSFIVFIYILLKSSLSYFKIYALEKVHNKNSIHILNICSYQKKILDYVSSFMKGRFLIVLFLTLFIWLVEFLALSYLVKQFFGSNMLEHNTLVCMFDSLQGGDSMSKVFADVSVLFEYVIFYSIFIVAGFIFLRFIPQKFRDTKRNIDAFQSKKNKYTLKNYSIRIEK